MIPYTQKVMRHRYHTPNINKSNKSDRVYIYMLAIKDSVKGQMHQKEKKECQQKKSMMEMQVIRHRSYTSNFEKSKCMYIYHCY